MSNPIINDIRSKFKSGNPVTRLITINVSVFLFISILKIILFLSGNNLTLNNFIGSLLDNLSFHLNLSALLHKPWTLITYMFTHIEIMHIFWNMMTLYWFGSILMEYTSSKKIIPLYLLGGIAGAIVTLIIFMLSPGLREITGSAIGASAGVTAIIIAAATLIPNYKLNLLFIGPVKLIYVAIFSIFIDVLNIANYSNIGGNIAHLGGALMGYIFILQYKKGNDLSKGINQFFDWFSNILKTGTRSKMKVVHKRSVSDEEYNFSKKQEQEIIDTILDKISKSGYESLTKREKEILFKASDKK